MTACFGSFLILHGRLKKGNNGFYVLREFFKVTINYLRQTRKLKGGNFSNQFSRLFWISKDGIKNSSVSKMRISFMTLLKLEKLSCGRLFCLISATTLVYVSD